MEAKRYRRSVTGRYLTGGFLVIACVLLAACASKQTTRPAQPSTEGDTSYRSVTKDGMAHYVLAMGEISTGAVPAEHPAPAYPPALLSARLPPQEVEALLIVDGQGKVGEVRIADEAQEDSQYRQFAEAVRATAMQWTFTPLRVSQWASDANGNTHEVGSETRPFSLDYVFRFAWKDGRPVTGASASAQGSH